MKSRAVLVLPALVAAFLAGGASPAAAAVCADHPNQASAQAAKDTRDADGDGIYCESLPCPCSTSSSSGGGSKPKATAPKKKAKPKKPKKQRLEFDARITRVTDGDTINVRKLGGKGKRYYKVRLIGIDTPETKKPGTPVQCGGLEATSNMLALAFPEPTDTNGDGLFDTAGAAGTGARVSVRTDITQDTYDRYGRLLAYVTRDEDDVNLARRQLADGWASVYVYNKPFAQFDSFDDAETTAVDAALGIWSLCADEE